MGKQIYFSKRELDNLIAFFEHWQEIVDEDEYAFWLKSIGSSEGKIYEARNFLEKYPKGKRVHKQ